MVNMHGQISECIFESSIPHMILRGMLRQTHKWFSLILHNILPPKAMQYCTSIFTLYCNIDSRHNNQMKQIIIQSDTFSMFVLYHLNIYQQFILKFQYSSILDKFLKFLKNHISCKSSDYLFGPYDHYDRHFMLCNDYYSLVVKSAFNPAFTNHRSMTKRCIRRMTKNMTGSNLRTHIFLQSPKWALQLA